MTVPSVPDAQTARTTMDAIGALATDLDLDPRPAGDPLSAELADIVLRTLELAEDLHIDLGAALLAKSADTVGRYRHGTVRF